MKRTKRLLISLLTLLCCCTGVWAEGELNGKFTINASGDKVQFSQGNLQATYNGSSWSWAFATNQWDYIGNAASNTSINGNGTVPTNGTVDLFGWSTSATTYGIHNSNEGPTYSGDFVDWGNTIGTGWRTLTSAEWVWILGPNSSPTPGTNCRASGSTVNGINNARYVHATINTDGTGVNGMILFPDGVTIDNSEATSWGTVNGNSAYATKCTSAQWTALAAKGCVFLPAAGSRGGTSVWNVGTRGHYWSSTSNGDYYAWEVDFSSEALQTQGNYSRYQSMSVRLVKDYTLQQDAEGELNGKFTINASGDKVQFSQGNLQYFCSTSAPEWRFAEHQYDYVAFDGSAYAENSEKWIDLFAHGTSGYDNGQTNYQPYVVGAGANTYYQGNLTGNADWGYNAISNGGNTENCGWRTLTIAEWLYLFESRSNAASKYGQASINGINGMILLPDSWTLPDGLSFTSGKHAWATNTYTIDQWIQMETAGAVFLPASGSCNSTGIPPESAQNQLGIYRASTSGNYIHFRQNDFGSGSYYQYGDAVRLVKDYTLQQDAEGNYLLGSVDDWKLFASLVQTTPTANAKMTADIDLGDDQTMVGSTSGNSYQGTFDGQGHTLTVNYNSTIHGIAPFQHVGAATISNLHVDGSIVTTGCGAGGIVSKISGNLTVSRCWVSATLQTVSSGGNRGTIGGIVSYCEEANCSIVIEDCVFTGVIVNTEMCGGLMSHLWNGSASVTMRRCLNVGTNTGANSYNYTFIRDIGAGHGTQNLETSTLFYKTAFGNAQGTQATTAELSDGTTTTALNAGRTGDEAVWVQNSAGYPWLRVFNPEIPVIRGDVNGDGEVDIDDATFVTNIILGTEEATEAADVNNDGTVSMPDAMFIVNKILNGKFPDEE